MVIIGDSIGTRDFVPLPYEDVGDSRKYAIVFTEVSKGGGPEWLARELTEREKSQVEEKHPFSYTTVIGDDAHIDFETGIVKAIEGKLSMIKIAPYDADAVGFVHLGRYADKYEKLLTGKAALELSSLISKSMSYDGIVGFHREKDVWLAVFPELKPRGSDTLEEDHFSRHISRYAPQGFIIPTLNTSPFAYCFIAASELGRIIYLYSRVKRGFEYDDKCDSLDELHLMMQDIFGRTNGTLEQYKPVAVDLIPEEYRKYKIISFFGIRIRNRQQQSETP